MKIKSILLFAAICSSTFMLAQNSSSVTPIPANVSQALQTKYPTATHVTWEMVQSYYEPVFKVNNVETAALIDLKGRVIQSEERLKPADLPVAATAYISSHYPNAPITIAAKVLTSANKNRYRATVSGHSLVFDPNGAFIEIIMSPLVY